ncbi:MAG: thioredoxin-dependent thiol peroxidase [Candidatus Latescibacteria bacterium]|nr:thioredoxin-dependent thiol peroxidase [Candidatus Latescibacterota bacterium]
MTQIGDPAPVFSLPDAGGRTVGLQDLRGKKVVLYFYPKDDTSGCTRESCDFRDAQPALEQAGVVVVGISPDSVRSHQRFREKYSLPFLLLADPERQAIEAYGVWKEKSMYGRKYMGVERSTFLIDEQGVLVAEWRKVKVIGHVEQILASLGLST